VKLSELGEFGLIARIARRFPLEGGMVRTGIGDDAAVLSLPDHSDLLFTTDQLIEGFHFRLDTTSGHDLGKKALAVNLSDIAAMGGAPIGFTLSLGIPSSRISVEFLDEFYEGIGCMARQAGAALLGGDTSEAGERFIISVALLGTAAEGRAVCRRGAAHGDDLYVTGWLGDAALGLLMLEQGIKDPETARVRARHLCPEPRLREGQLLAERGIPHAMIDVSDGLLADLGHLLEASGLGVEIELAALPLSSDFQLWAGELAPDPVRMALGGGEDYELLFCAPPAQAAEVERLRAEISAPLTRIGRISREIEGIVLRDTDGCTRHVLPLGHDHFGPKAA
jgi:thiamine-monophosphate kinase